MEVGVSLGALCLALVVARLLPVSPIALVCVVLAVPVALTLDETLRREHADITRNASLSDFEAEVLPPIRWAAWRNVELLAGIRRVVPRDATISFFPGGRWLAAHSREEARTVYLQSGWVRWVAFAVAPRIVVDGARGSWAVLADQTPAAAGIEPKRAWRFGRDWLVER